MGEPPTDFQRLRALCQRARGLDPDGLSRFLEKECGEDHALAEEVRRVLQFDGGGDELESPAHEAMGLDQEEVLDHVTLTQVGAGASDTEWDEFLKQVQGRGSNWTRYEDQGEVAHGGMGAIHRVFDQDLRRTLAMKVILNRDGDPADTDASLGRFLEEAQVTSQLDHPGIVPVHELGVDERSQVYFTMKLVKGEDLRAVFERVLDPSDEDWNETRALNVILRVCEAMAYAHTKGVIHRDLKPGNVMVGKFGETYVMDWGLARVLGRDDTRDMRPQVDASSSLRSERKDAAGATPDSPILTLDGAVVGTPAYMPPEQALGKVDELGPPADVYAVGALLYHLLTGRMPYSQPGGQMSPRTILALVTQGPPPPLEELRSDVPPELAAIVERAMSREIADRYADMMALARDLRAYLEQRVVAAYESGGWAELKKWVARNRELAATVAVAIVAVIALAGWALIERDSARQNEQVALANETEANNQRNRADEEKNIAIAERDRVRRLSDKRRLDLLVTEANAPNALWPAQPDKLDALRKWQTKAADLIARLPLHEATLAEVRTKGAPIEDPRDRTLASLRAHVGAHATREEFEEEEFDDDAALAEHVTDLNATIAALAETIDRQRGHEFGDDVDARWWHDAVRDLVVGLHALKGDDIHGATVAGIAARLSWAETVEERTTTGTEVATAWARAKKVIRTHPKYGELELEPQVGLVPLGADPESTLWEFGHPQTGDLPIRDPETGKLAITEASGLVFVLIPGGTYRLGAQKEDENAPHYDPQAESRESPLHEVSLSPYFLSKYEMTQGQWARFTGENPSYYLPKSDLVKTLQHPVEQVNWDTCGKTLSRLGLVLPTEAQWEAACRAGTETPWSTGREKEALEGFANLADQAATRSGATWPDIADWPELDDGFAVHAPVGSYQANGFGLHDMHGNVWELCRDSYSSSAYGDITPNEGDGLRDVPAASYRVARGGGFDFLASVARSASRTRNSPEFRNENIGLRPARLFN